MALNGIRFAVDKETQLQYKIEFKDGKIANIDFYGSKADVQKVFSDCTFTAYDDQPMLGEDENGDVTSARPVYTVQLKIEDGKPSVIDYDIEAIDQNLPLPAQHRTGFADQARGNTGRPSQDDILGALADQLKKAMTNPAANNNDTGPVPNQGTQTGPKVPRPKPTRKITIANSAVENALTKYGTDLTERARNGALDPVIGRDKERREIRQLLLRKKRASIMLLGDAGVGKTALAEALAQDIANGNAEAELGNARVIALNLQDMNAGTQFRGMFEERILPILKGLEERGGYLNGQKIILFLDEIHSALTAGNAMGGTNAGEIMKPYLAGDSLTCIGATTPEEYKKHIEKNKALVRRFQPYTIEEPKKEDSLTIMKGVQKTYSEHHGMAESLSDKMVEYIVRMTDRFMPTQQQPDKSIAISDDAMATARFHGRDAITEADVISAISKATGLKEEFLNQSDFERYACLEDELKKRVIGQDESIGLIASDLRASRAGLTKDSGPRGVYIVPGPTGVGKTEFTKALAELLMGDEDNLIRLDMGKYQEKHTVSSLIGAPPGFVGHDNENGGELTEPVRQKPFSIVLLDEIEKAHPDIFHTLLSVFDDGELKDSKGRKIDFTNTIFVMTTNLGAKEMQAMIEKKSVGFNTADLGVEDGSDDADVTKAEIAAIAQKAVEKHFPPELVNRVDGVYPFYQLGKAEVTSILELRLKDVEKSLRESAHGLQLNNAQLHVSKTVKDHLAEKGYTPKFGARPLNRAIKRELTSKLGLWMMENKAELLKRNESGPFKITINSLSGKFNPKITAVKPTPAKKPKKDMPSAA